MGAWGESIEYKGHEEMPLGDEHVLCTLIVVLVMEVRAFIKTDWTLYLQESIFLFVN